jgi:hypothetical protein
MSHIWRREIQTKFSLKHEVKRLLGDLGVDGRIILK